MEIKMKYLKDKSLGYALHYTNRMSMALLQERIKQHNVAVGQFPVLVHLWEEQGITQKALCDLIRVEQPTLANTLKRMERDGLIKRTPDKEDKRQWRIYLTDRSLALKDGLQEESRSVNKIIVGRLDETEQKEFIRLIGIITSTLEDELSKGRSPIKEKKQ
jgi:MarR family transcriptional regulator, transcriptional regulator for hemolysin